MKKSILLSSIIAVIMFFIMNNTMAQTPYPVTVNPTPTVDTVGSSAPNYCAGSGGVTITLSNSDGGTIKYYLYKNSILNDSLAGIGLPLAWNGKLFGTYTISAKNTTTGCTTPMSGTTIITENPVPIFAINVPLSSTICEASTTTFSATATVTTGTISGYYWEEYSGGIWHTITSGGIYSGTNTSTLTLTGVTNTMNGYQYRCIATTSTFGCTTTSNVATLTVIPLPTITVQPQPTTACDLQTNVTISVGDNAATHQWQLSTNGITWNNVTNGAVYSGVNTSVLNIVTATPAMNNYQYRCIISSAPPASCLVISNSATLTVNTLPTAFNIGPATTHYCFGSGGVSINLSNSTTGIDYQLYKDSIATGLPLHGTGFSLTWTGQLFGTYTIVATNTVTFCSKQMTGSAIITEDPLPTAGTVIWGAPCSDGQMTVNINNLTGTSPWTISVFDQVAGVPGTAIYTQSVSVSSPTISFTPNWVGTQNKYIWMQDSNGCSAWK